MINLTTVILSGGAGARLWPLSREGHPKPFIKLVDGQTLIEKTYTRAKSLGSKIITVTNRDYYFMSRDELDRVGTEGKFILEPFGRNTAPAIALAAKLIEETQGSDAIMLVLPADHLIGDQVGFAAAVSEATNLALQDYLVTFGIEPDTPETGFGYIELGHTLGAGNKVARFVEKPNVSVAEKYVASGNYLWNSGMFCFKARTLLQELAQTSPEVAESVDHCWAAMQTASYTGLLEIPGDAFQTAPNISIDYAVMEKSDRVAVIRGSFGWNDIGSWSAIRDLVEPDASNNRVLGTAIFLDTKNTFVQSEGRLVATVGVNDLMIIDTSDALLVSHSDKVQDVKKIFTLLKTANHESYKLHRTVVRPWGSYTIIEECPGFKIKRIEVKPSASLSLQKHHHRSEHWVVVSGTAKITKGDDTFWVKPNESTYIPVGEKHRLENPDVLPCVIIEIQCGSYLGEDDIVRYEDKYGRGHS